MSAQVVSGVEPESVWRWFEVLCGIPRPSGHEEGVTLMLRSFAAERGLDCLVDDVGNVLIRVAGSGACSASPPLCLQAHTDMVAEKLDSSAHDFLRDPIRIEVEGDWVLARETTLGADNGIGVALMLALADSADIPHPPLECLFTIDEERGLTGASRLDPSWIAARRLINLDTEEEGRFCIGCAGGIDAGLTLRIGTDETLRGVPRTVRVEGLRGGHSGMEIGRCRANSIRLLAHTLDTLLEIPGTSLVEVSGGSKRNAIPRTAGALVMIGDEAAADAAVALLDRRFRDVYQGIEPFPSITLQHPEPAARPSMSSGSARRLVDLLLALPHGVEKRSGISHDLVETSCNLAIVETSGDQVDITMTVRSLLEEGKALLVRRLAAAARIAGAGFRAEGGYPGWKPDPSSRLLSEASDFHSAFYGRPPLVETIHAGLECGIIGDRIGGMDMISMGPDIRDVHAPGERVSVSSTERFWRFLTGFLARL
jgi:dipeptidase D